MVFILLIPLNFKVGGGEDWERFCIHVDCVVWYLYRVYGLCVLVQCEGEGGVFVDRKPYEIIEHTPGLLIQFGLKDSSANLDLS